MGPSIWQLLIVLVIIILIFGTKKLRNMGGDLGSAIRNFKKSAKEGEEEVNADERLEDNSGRVIEGKASRERKDKVGR